VAETTDAVLGYLQNKTPQQIEQTLRNLERMSVAQAEETGAIAARQAAADEKMSLDEVSHELEKANASSDFAAIAKWAPIHQRKLQWVSDQVQADETARLEKINKPVIEARQARRTELLAELNELTKTNVSQNFDRMRIIQQELKGLQ
jgi:hypothetical protein